jgi:RNA polymerase sigma-70 factor (ECF subfamily)
MVMSHDRVADLAAEWRAAREVWPSVEVSFEDFADYVKRVTPSAGTEGALPATPALHGSHLYLACACVKGDAAALAAFEEAFFREVDVAAATLTSHGLTADDLRQAVRQHLFLAEPGKVARIATYSGRGDLRAWVRIVATRTALNMVAKPRRELPFDVDALAFLVGSGDDPELEYIRRTYATAFREAFRVALAALEDRERNLIRYAFGDGLSADAIGHLYGVHRATATRWLVKAHSHLADEVRKALVSHLGIDHKDYASIVRWVKSHLQITLEGCVGESATSAGDHD